MVNTYEFVVSIYSVTKSIDNRNKPLEIKLNKI